MSEVRDYSWGTYAEQKSENECYENLSNAVIQQAVADMADAVYRKELAERQIVESNKTFAECVKFFSSDKYRDMTTVSGEIVLDAAIKQGKYLVWKHDRGCSRCKYAKNKQCKHGKGGAANWYSWDKGDRNCFWYQSKKAIGKRKDAEGDTNG